MAEDGAADVRSVEVEKWGTVYVRDMTAGEADRWMSKSKEALGDLADVNPTAFAAAMIICDDKGERVFDPLDRDDLDFLSGRRKRDLDRIMQAGAAAGN